MSEENQVESAPQECCPASAGCCGTSPKGSKRCPVKTAIFALAMAAAIAVAAHAYVTRGSAPADGVTPGSRGTSTSCSLGAAGGSNTDRSSSCPLSAAQGAKASQSAASACPAISPPREQTAEDTDLGVGYSDAAETGTGAVEDRPSS